MYIDIEIYNRLIMIVHDLIYVHTYGCTIVYTFFYLKDLIIIKSNIAIYTNEIEFCKYINI